MANTFVLIAQQPLDFKGHHYETGDRFVADAYESPVLRVKGLAIEASQEEQRAHGAHAPRRRGRPRKTVTPEADV